MAVQTDERDTALRAHADVYLHEDSVRFLSRAPKVALDMVPLRIIRWAWAKLKRPSRVLVGGICDRRIPTSDGGCAITVRTYYPPASSVRGEHARPIVVLAHGGGFAIGSLETHDDLCRRLCVALRAAVVAVDYRLAPEHPFPAGLDDVVAGYKWVLANVDALGGDARNPKIIVTGDSAGGNLAIGLCLRAIQSRKSATPLPLPSLLMPLYPCTDFRMLTPSISQYATGFYLTRRDMCYFRRMYIGPDGSQQQADHIRNPLVSPLLADPKELAQLPPTILVTAEHDPLYSEGRAFAQAIEALGVPCDYVEARGLVHGFFSAGEFFKTALPDVIEDLAKRVEKFLKTPGK